MTEPDLRYMFRCKYADLDYPMIEFSSFRQTPQSGCIPPVHPRMGTDPVTDVVFFRI
jgi:hypothetical protein